MCIRDRNLTSSALEQDLTGVVSSKGIMIAPPSMQDPNPFASVDRKTGRVIIALDDNQAAKNLINLQVDVEIKIGNDQQDSGTVSLN